MGNYGSDCYIQFTNNCLLISGYHNSGIQIPPFLLTVILEIIFDGIIPLFLHIITQEKRGCLCVSISECWRAPGSFLSTSVGYIINMIILDGYCFSNGNAKAIAAAFFTLKFLVSLINPPDKNEESYSFHVAQMDTEKGRKAHGVLAFGIFTFMLILTLWLTSTTLTQAAGFTLAVFLCVPICIIWIVFLVVAWHDIGGRGGAKEKPWWKSLVSGVEWFYAFLNVLIWLAVPYAEIV